MSAPVVEIGVNPTIVPPITIADTSSMASAPSVEASPLAVGIRVGNTTPRPELKKDSNTHDHRSSPFAHNVLQSRYHDIDTAGQGDNIHQNANT